MRIAILIVASLLLASGCEDILPVETVDLCEQPDPPSSECPQCDSAPFARDCPQCRGDAPAAGCENAPAGASGDDGGRADASTSAGDGAGAGTGAGRGGSGTGAGRGGSGGGSGGRDDAGACAACPEATPMCLADSECVQCLEHDDCAASAAGGGSAARCEPESHACVECLGDDDCGSAEPRCDPGAHACVECLTSADCDADEPVCGSNHRCGPCSGDDECEARTDATYCDTDADSARAGECVECLGNGHCANPEPQCTQGECTPCTADEACETREGFEVCNTRPDVQTSGQCVECTGATEAAKCDDRACNQLTGACTDVERGSLLACNRCVADSQCDAATKCVPFELDGHDLGHFCFLADQDEDGPTHCADLASVRRPYNQFTVLTSIDGAQGGYCLPITTCLAVEHASGTPRSCTGNSSCGEPDVNDGYCPDSGPAMGKCSYTCEDSADCPGLGATSCSGVGLKFCQAP